MKAATHPRRYKDIRGASYPNAATRQQITEKLVNMLLTGAIGAATAAIFMFLAALS